MTSSDAAHAEVRGLHEFFVAWFNNGLADTDDNFRRVEHALHRDFSMVLPTGTTLDRATAVAQIRGAHASAGADHPAGIEIVDIVTLATGHDATLLRYEERQFAGGELQNRRVSTAYFVSAPDAPTGVQWLRLHETMLDAGGR